MIGGMFTGKALRELFDVMEIYLDLSGSYTDVYISKHQVVYLRFVHFILLFLFQKIKIRNYTIQLQKSESFITGIHTFLLGM